MNDTSTSHPVLLCFDGSDNAAAAIVTAGELLGPRSALVLTVTEPIKLWHPSDPATILDAPVGKLLAKALELEQLADQFAQDEMNRGVELARAAGFDARGRLAHGKAWRAICDLAAEVDAAAIVLGARGLSRVQSALLGSVSAAVSSQTRIPVLIVHQLPTRTTGGTDRVERVAERSTDR